MRLQKQSETAIEAIGKLLARAGVWQVHRKAKPFDNLPGWTASFAHVYVIKMVRHGRLWTSFVATDYPTPPHKAAIILTTTANYLTPIEADNGDEVDVMKCYHELNHDAGEQGARMKRMLGNDLFQQIVGICADLKLVPS